MVSSRSTNSEAIARSDEQRGFARPRAHSAGCVGGAFEQAQYRRAGGDDATAARPAGDDLRRRADADLAALGVHDVILDVLRPERKEGARAYVQGHRDTVDAGGIERHQQVGREVQSGGRRRHGTRPRREHRPVVFAIARIPVGTADIGRQRWHPVRLQLLDHPFAAAGEIEQHRAVLALVRDLGGEVRGEADAVTGPQSAGGADKRPPASRLRLIDQRRLDGNRPAPAEEACGQHLGVIDDQQVTGPQQARQIAHRPVFRPFTQTQQPGGVARACGMLRDRAGGQREIEFTDPHRAGSLLERVQSLKARLDAALHAPTRSVARVREGEADAREPRAREGEAGQHARRVHRRDVPEP